MLATLMLTSLLAAGESAWPGHHHIDETAAAAHLEACRATWSTADEWLARRGRIRGHIANVMGLDLDGERAPVGVTVTDIHERDGYTVSNLLVETAPGVFVGGNLYLPEDASVPMPAVLCAHGHYRGSDDDGPGRFRADQQRLCATLARAGAAALTWDMVGWARDDRLEHATPETSALQTFNTIRMVDWISSRSDVDPNRIGMTGSSGGGTQTFLATALDERIAASAPVVMVSAHFFGGCACESGLPIHHGPHHRTNNVEIAACAAPRPQRLVSCGGDWTRNTPSVEFPALQEVYAALGVSEACSNVHLADEGHDLGPNKRAAVYDFFAEAIGTATVSDEPSIDLLEQHELEADLTSILAPASTHALALDSARALMRGDGDRPNVVIILADDMGQGDPGCFNSNSRIETPAINRLAAEGLRMTDAHSPSAVCTPTRYGLITGRYAWRTKLKKWVLGGYSPMLPCPERSTIASLLDDAGYETCVIGKWHLGLGNTDPADFDQPLRPGPLEMGFDLCQIIPASLDMPPYCWVVDDAPEVAPTAHTPGSKHRRQGGDGMWRTGAIAPGFEFDQVLASTGDRAEAFIEQAQSPFLLYVPLTSPHTPWVPSEAFTGATDLGHYGDFVVETDAVVGRVLEALDRTGHAENTIVVFTSDNGAHWQPGEIETHDHHSNNHWRGMKADIHEGGHRVPFVVRWPGVIPAGSTSDELTCLTDLHATIAAATGTPHTGGEDSANMLPVWRGAHMFKPVHDAIVLHSGDGMFALRSGRWKLIEGLGSGGFTRPRRIDASDQEVKGQLYDLEADPGETTNLWAERPDVVERLTALLQAVRDKPARLK